MKRKLEESKRQVELEKLREENERFQKHRQQVKDKVRGRMFCSSFLNFVIISV